MPLYLYKIQTICLQMQNEELHINYDAIRVVIFFYVLMISGSMKQASYWIYCDLLADYQINKFE